MPYANKQDKLKTWELLGYAMGGFGSNIMWSFLASFVLFFFTDLYGISPAIAGSIIFFTRFFDAVTDPLFAMIADRTNTKYGRFRPYIMIGAPLLGLSLIGLYWGPALSESGKLVYVITLYLMYSIFSTIVNVPYHALTPVMTNDYHERMSVVTAKQTVGIIGTYAATGLSMKLIYYLSDSSTLTTISAWRMTAVVIAIFGCLSYWLCALGATRRDTPEWVRTQNKKETVSFIDGLKVIWKNPALLAVLVGNGTNTIANVIAGGTGLYFFKYYLQNPKAFSSYQFYVAVICFVSYLCMPFIVKLLPKHKVFVQASIWGMFFCMIPVVAVLCGYQLTFNQFFALLLIEMFFTQVAGLMAWALLPDCVEYSEYKTGIRGDATVSASMMFINKIGAALAGGITGYALSWAGYLPNVLEQTPKVLLTILMCKFLTVAVGHLCSILAFINFPLTPVRYKEIILALYERRAKEAMNEVINKK